MTPEKQKEFIIELSYAISRDLCEKVDKGRVPESWDGHELRALLGYRHEQSASMSIVCRTPRSKRARNFRNHLLTENL